jgi:hypothetical protein
MDPFNPLDRGTIVRQCVEVDAFDGSGSADVMIAWILRQHLHDLDMAKYMQPYLAIAEVQVSSMGSMYSTDGRLER